MKLPACEPKKWSFTSYYGYYPDTNLPQLFTVVMNYDPLVNHLLWLINYLLTTYWESSVHGSSVSWSFSSQVAELLLKQHGSFRARPKETLKCCCRDTLNRNFPAERLWDDLWMPNMKLPQFLDRLKWKIWIEHGWFGYNHDLGNLHIWCK